MHEWLPHVKLRQPNAAGLKAGVTHAGSSVTQLPRVLCQDAFRDVPGRSMDSCGHCGGAGCLGAVDTWKEWTLGWDGHLGGMDTWMEWMLEWDGQLAGVMLWWVGCLDWMDV